MRGWKLETYVGSSINTMNWRRDNGAGSHSLMAYATKRRRRPSYGVSIYMRRRGYDTLPLFDEDYINPARMLSPEQIALWPVAALTQRLNYLKHPGFGDQPGPGEVQAIRRELRRRKTTA